MYNTSSMGFALLVIFMFVAFGLTTLFRRWIDIPTLIAVAIGAAVNANIFNPITAPVPLGSLIFSIEIVLYTLFMYTIVVRILDYGYKAATTMTFTSIAAIIISAIIELFSNLASSGFTIEAIKLFSSYLFSSIGTIVGVLVMIWITIKCRKKNISCYLIIPIAIIVSSVIHAIFFYGGIALVEWRLDAYQLNAFIGTLIGKAVCIALSVLCYFINKNYWRPLNLIEHEEGNKDN